MYIDTSELCDIYADQVDVVEPIFSSFGGVSNFYGKVTTVKCFENNGLIAEILEENGEGRVLVVDGGGAVRRALIDAELAQLAADNDWAGIIVYGAVRQIQQLENIDIGIHALAPIPVGADENNPDGIFEPGMKTGSMVTAFVNEYYKLTHIPVLAVSASKGGSSISEWQGNNDFLSDAIARYRKATEYAQKNHIEIRHKYVLWCQGETDGDRATDIEAYGKLFINMFSQLQGAGIEKCFMITIGEYNGELGYENNYVNIRNKQLDIAKSMENIVLVCDEFHKMKARGLMKDDFHYYQEAYNEVGTIAGKTAGAFVMDSSLGGKNDAK